MSRHTWIGGVHAVREALNQGKILQVEVAENKRSKNLNALLEELQQADIAIETVPAYAIDMRLPDVRHQGIAAEIRLDAQMANWQHAIAGIDKPLILILDHLQDPHNLGACLRSAAAAGVDAVIMPNARAAEVTAVVEKVACGAVSFLPIFQVSNLKREIQMMKEKGIWIVAGAGEAEQSVYDLDLTTGLALVVGNEADGVSYGVRQLCDYMAAIPMRGEMESLNVSVACGVMLFEINRQRYIASKAR